MLIHPRKLIDKTPEKPKPEGQRRRRISRRHEIIMIKTEPIRAKSYRIDIFRADIGRKTTDPKMQV